MGVFGRFNLAALGGCNLGGCKKKCLLCYVMMSRSTVTSEAPPGHISIPLGTTDSVFPSAICTRVSLSSSIISLLADSPRKACGQRRHLHLACCWFRMHAMHLNQYVCRGATIMTGRGIGMPTVHSPCCKGLGPLAPITSTRCAVVSISRL